MDMLRARLYELELRQREERANEVEAGKTEIGWGPVSYTHLPLPTLYSV